MPSTGTSDLGQVVLPGEVSKKLRANDRSFWKLVLDKLPTRYSNDCSIFCAALNQNKTVSSVVVKSPFLLNLPDSQQNAVMDAIGNLPSLEELYLTRVTASVLTIVLKNASKLRRLKLGKIKIPSKHDFAEFTLALKGCTSLVEISLESLQVVVQDNHRITAEGKMWFEETESSQKDLVLDPLFEAMASLPNLEKIQLEQHLNGGRIAQPSEKSLRLLCQSPRKSLVLDSCELSDEQCFVIANELRTNALPLSTLVVDGANQLSSKAWNEFVEMLAVNYNITRFDRREGGQTSEQLAKIRHYLKLNTRGRKELLCGPTTTRPQVWFDFLVKGRNDLDLVFFALVVDPSVYSVGAGA